MLECQQDKTDSKERTFYCPIVFPIDPLHIHARTKRLYNSFHILLWIRFHTLCWVDTCFDWRAINSIPKRFIASFWESGLFHLFSIHSNLSNIDVFCRLSSGMYYEAYTYYIHLLFILSRKVYKLLYIGRCFDSLYFCIPITLFGCLTLQGGRQNLSKYSANGSITSHCTMPSDCPDLLNRSFSSARYNNWYSTSGTHCTSISNGCNSMHPRQTPAHRPYATSRCCHPAICPPTCISTTDSGHGRLHKSLSFAFQTPMTRSDIYRTYHGAPPGYATTGRIRSRWVVTMLDIWCLMTPSIVIFQLRFMSGISNNWSYRCDVHRPHVSIIANGLQHHPSRSRSVPENLAHVSAHHGSDCQCRIAKNNTSGNHWRSSSFRHPNRQVVEQITTSV